MHVLEAIEKGGKRPEKSHVSQILRLSISQLNRLFLCIDALDELGPRVRLELLKVLDTEFCTARIFLTGRPHIQSEVNSIFQGQNNPIHITANLDDVQAYLTHEIELDVEVNPDDMNKQLKQEILEAIINKAEGM